MSDEKTLGNKEEERKEKEEKRFAESVLLLPAC